ncbi:MAG: peptidoglycan DD-metalloendopeptidase family protein [Burkholderiales bacterium]|nr:peptidoglycan DD-metalloendopeptidase family protein [Burkholderiales bacterium]
MPLNIFSYQENTQSESRLAWSRTVLGCVFSVSALLLAATSDAQTLRSKEKKKVEAERTELQQKLDVLKKDIRKTENAKERASDALEASEQAISDANRALLNLQAEQQKAQAALQVLMNEIEVLNRQVEQQKQSLSRFLRQQYQEGASDRIKLLLSGDNPNRINRDLQYMSYISKTQAKLIAALQASLVEIEQKRQAAQEVKDELEEIAQEEREHKKGLESQKKKRAAILAELATKLRSQRKEADNLRRDEQLLNALLRKLDEQAKAEQAKQRALAEKQRKERQSQEKAQAGKGTDSTTGKKVIIEQTPELGFNDGQVFARLKGQLRLPVVGELLAKFGQKRIDSLNWKGLFIKATEGADVKAIGAGRVVTATWMRGYGNLIVLDHGGDFLSIYGGNQAVLKNVGDQVKAGEKIASAGNTFGYEESGLYFEMRHKGQPLDPLSWTHK